MANVKNGRMFSAEFNKATEVNSQTRLLAQTPNEPVEYVDLEQVAEVVNEGMATQANLNTTNENVATNARNIQTIQNEVDNRYTKEQTNAQISEAINEVDQTNKDTYATKTGEYKELTAGFAYEILGDGQATAEKFSFRPTGGPNRNVRDGSARIEVLKGNSVVWNQRVDKKWTFSKKNDSDSPQGSLVGGIGDYVKTLDGHKVYMVATSTSNSGDTFYINLSQSIDINGAGAIFTYTNPNSTYVGLYATIPAHTEINTEVTLLIHDLTQMFGADIANNITKPEQFYEMLPIVANPNAYNEGEIIDGSYGAIKTVGFNAFNGTYAKVCGGCPYYLGGNYTLLGFTTEEGGTIETITLPTSTESVGTTPSDRLYTPSQNGYIYAEGTNININLSWDTEYGYLNGTYKPYKPFERDLSWVAKYFPNGRMRRAGNVADEIRFNSTTQQWEAVQRIGVVDLGSLTWSYSATNPCFYTIIKDIVPLTTNILSNKFIFDGLVGAQNPGDNIMSVHGDGICRFRDNSYGGDVSAFKAGMQGVMFYYELATPDVKTITEDVNLAYDIADYGTEQLIVAEGAQSAPLSAEIVYENNASMLLKQIAPALDRLDAVEAILATMQASAVATTNEE